MHKPQFLYQIGVQDMALVPIDSNESQQYNGRMSEKKYGSPEQNLSW